MPWKNEWIKPVIDDYHYWLSPEVAERINKDYEEWVKNHLPALFDEHLEINGGISPVVLAIKENLIAIETGGCAPPILIVDEIVFICQDCGKELNPHTNSFAKLCEYAKQSGWTLEWLDSGYETRCKECI